MANITSVDARSTSHRSNVKVTHRFWGAYNHSTGSINPDFGALWELLGALLKSSWLLFGLLPCFQLLRASLFFVLKFVFQNYEDLSAETLTFDHNSQDLSAENVISEARKAEISQLFMNVSSGIAVFQNSRDVSTNFLTFFG